MLIVRHNLPTFITGASGFIGGKIAERLLAEGRRVRVLSRRELPHLEALGAEVILGDLDNREALRRGCQSAETVFHVAGRVGVWGPDKEFFAVNVGGTKNVINACREAGVPRLVYTSSPSVVYNGGDLAGVNESAPLCTEAPCSYPTSKAAAEREVLAAHGPTLATVALRPHLVWGPGDKNVVPRVLALAKAGRPQDHRLRPKQSRCDPHQQRRRRPPPRRRCPRHL
jgi:nucleoside-diphosphate-sugar epimerase